MWASASQCGHVSLVRCLLGKAAAIDKLSWRGYSALWFASFEGWPAVVRLLLESGADPTIATLRGSTPLLEASCGGHLEVVRLLLGLPGGKATLNHRDRRGDTALWRACFNGRGRVARALLESGADPTIASGDGTTPMTVAKQDASGYHGRISAEGRRMCVAALDVSVYLTPPLPRHLLFCFNLVRRAWGVVLW
jgi:ankyrin repeat protein